MQNKACCSLHFPGWCVNVKEKRAGYGCLRGMYLLWSEQFKAAFVTAARNLIPKLRVCLSITVLSHAQRDLWVSFHRHPGRWLRWLRNSLFLQSWQLTSGRRHTRCVLNSFQGAVPVGRRLDYLHLDFWSPSSSLRPAREEPGQSIVLVGAGAPSASPGDC